MEPTAARRLDARAVERIVRRLDSAAEAPWLAREVARRLGERLDLVKRSPARIVDASGWLGAGEPEWSRRYPAAQAWSVEPDVARAERRRAAARPWWLRWRRSNVAPLAADAPWPGVVGLVWSNLALVADPDPPATFGRWRTALADDGFVMFSSLGPGTLPELRQIYAERQWGPPSLDFVDMHDLGDMMVHAGLADPVMDQETLRITWTEASSALAELRGLGGNAAPQRMAGLRTPRWRGQLERALQALARPGEPVTLSFEVVYGHAFAAVPKAARSGQTTVSLDAMRDLVRAGRERSLR